MIIPPIFSAWSPHTYDIVVNIEGRRDLTEQHLLATSCDRYRWSCVSWPSHSIRTSGLWQQDTITQGQMSITPVLDQCVEGKDERTPQLAQVCFWMCKLRRPHLEEKCQFLNHLATGDADHEPPAESMRLVVSCSHVVRKPEIFNLEEGLLFPKELVPFVILTGYSSRMLSVRGQSVSRVKYRGIRSYRNG